MSSVSSERLQEEVMKAVNTIDVEYLRRMQAQMHRCAAACCDDRRSSMESVQKCVMNCGSQLQAAQKFVQGELNTFQDRLSRCHMACSDKIRDEMGGNPNELDIQKFKEKLEKCSENCAETHIKLVATLLGRTKEVLSQNEFQRNLM